MAVRDRWVIAGLVLLSACASSEHIGDDGLVRVEGTLEMVGGPAPGVTLPVAGEVTLASGGRRYTVTAGSDGSFVAEVKPGTYTVTGRSPRYNGGEGKCFAERPSELTDSQSGHHVTVVCPMK